MTETPKYSVIQKQKDIEIRHYPGTIEAEVSINDAGYKSAAEKGFRILAGYIFGNNTSRKKIDMTAPVQISQSEKIAMTTPVTVRGSDQFTVAFIMPAEYTLESLPVPKDGRIRIRPVPERTVAAIRFSGYFNQDRIEKSKRKLKHWIEENGFQTEGDFAVAGYNPPWVPGFLARNEVLIKILSP